MNQDVKVVNTSENSKDGQNKCPKCGATDITLNVSTGKLVCDYCRYEFVLENVKGLEEDLTKLEGQVVGSGASDIVMDSKDSITLKCSSCGAEVVIDTLSSTQARCHWCRNVLSINNQIPNGSVPDVVLPFNITKDEAKSIINNFVTKRSFYANPKFKQEFTTDNIMGVYFPYMVVDVNSHAKFSGQGEHLLRRYTVGSGNNQKTRYDAELYNVLRDFDLLIKGLTVESNSERRNTSKNTNNVINAIMPFDIENSVKYDSNYLKGFTSERRDSNVEDLKNLVSLQCKDVAKFSINYSLKNYDRGVRWDSEVLDIKGQQWKAAYLPVWLYSYQDNHKTLHYVAVNARTKKVMGSVPLHLPKLILVSSLIEILCLFATVSIEFEYSYLFLSIGVIYFIVMYIRYRNSNARHKYETDTKTEVSNLKTLDDFVQKKTGLSNSKIEGANNKSVSMQSVGDVFLDAVSDNEIAKMFIDKDK